MHKINESLAFFDPIARMTTISKIDHIDSMKIVQQKISIKPSRIASVLLIDTLLFVSSFFIKITSIFVWFFCQFFPFYFTIIALRNGNKQKYTKYLIYWIFYVGLSQLQPYLRIFVDRTFFNMIKISATVLILNDSFDMGNRLFENVIKPMFEKQSVKSMTGNIESFINKRRE